MGTTSATALPLLGLRITAGPLELRGITDDLLGPLADLAIAGIHEPDFMPFATPWTIAPADELPLGFAQFHWRSRAEFSPKKWNALFAVSWEGELAGTQGIETQDYLVTRTGETGSWLGRRFQGRGIGTAMRQVICAFAFDHLDAEHVTSAAFADNAASLAVSKKAGYEDQGWHPVERLGKQAILRRLMLEPASLVRYEHPLTVTGLAEFRRSIGLDATLGLPAGRRHFRCAYHDRRQRQRPDQSQAGLPQRGAEDWERSTSTILTATRPTRCHDSCNVR